mmetsp:Transcript_3426/g.13031  ORF Transcript_3426/g.13031 Transcript_3426/m.13031 type:complete len:212 (-) Transcript_3426:1189-1824(-)
MSENGVIQNCRGHEHLQPDVATLHTFRIVLRVILTPLSPEISPAPGKKFLNFPVLTMTSASRGHPSANSHVCSETCSETTQQTFDPGAARFQHAASAHHHRIQSMGFLSIISWSNSVLFFHFVLQSCCDHLLLLWFDKLNIHRSQRCYCPCRIIALWMVPREKILHILFKALLSDGLSHLFHELHHVANVVLCGHITSGTLTGGHTIHVGS